MINALEIIECGNATENTNVVITHCNSVALIKKPVN